MGRPKIYNSERERRAAFNKGKDRFDVFVPEHIGATIRELSEHFGASNSEVIQDFIRFALTNRNWRAEGLLWSTHKHREKP